MTSKAVRESDGPCMGCKTEKAERFLSVVMTYQHPNIPDRSLITVCPTCTTEVFNTSNPVEILAHIRAKHPYFHSAQYLGFDDKYRIRCKETGMLTRTGVCVECQWFAHFDESHLSGIFCSYQTDEDIKERERTKKIWALECPECGGKLDDNRIKEGSHKGHGSISCPKCEKNLVWI